MVASHESRRGFERVALYEPSQLAATYYKELPPPARLLGVCLVVHAVGPSEPRHNASGDYLAGFGATYVDERVVEDGKFMTGAGVTAGLDMALTLVARLAGDQMARAIQLSAHYDPQPPFPVEHHTTAIDLLPIINDELGPA